MNYPVWDVAFGAGLLIAMVAILHVFVSHFAVGGGLFLVLTERRALRHKDTEVLGWLRKHTWFFVLITVVYGAVSGVGIWFTIGLIQPSATSSLIHAYVWGWAIEWVFFFLEITAALLYLYGWDKVDPKLHLWYGWIYSGSAFASMVIINGIITFMLTSGKWIQNHEFWTGFFNPTYFPSLGVRAAIALGLAGIYALLTASRLKDASLKSRLVKWSALWTLPSMAALPLLVWWYIRSIPPEVWGSARGPMPTASLSAQAGGVLAAVTLMLVLLTLIRPARLRLAHSILILLAALGTMGAFEFVREGIRKPFVIANYLYGNSLYATPAPGDSGFSVEAIDQNGVLNTARWVRKTRLSGQADWEAGREIFRVECQSCHTSHAYRGLSKLLGAREWTPSTLKAMMGSLDLAHNGVMPPFAGTDAERDALTFYLTSLYPEGEVSQSDGEHLFQQNCGSCHEMRAGDSAIAALRALQVDTAAERLENLPDLFVRMPDLKLTEEQRVMLVRWIQERFPAPGSSPRPGAGETAERR